MKALTLSYFPEKLIHRLKTVYVYKMDDKEQGQEKDTRRCACCIKKLPLTTFPCRCGKKFCSAHRIDSAHACTFDYKKQSQNQLSTILVKVNGEKLDYI